MAGHAASSTRGSRSTTHLLAPLDHAVGPAVLTPVLSPVLSPAEQPHEGTALVATAHRTAHLLLDPGSDRWHHTAGVVARAMHARAAVPASQADVLVAAAWLHDVGYAPALRRTGFHPFDGAWHLREAGWPEPVVGLVAHHSGARHLARAEGLEEHLADFPDARGWTGPLAEALLWADQTTSPQGHPVTLEHRLAEARARHGEGSALARAHADRAPEARRAAAATERRMARVPFDVRD